MLLHLIFRSQNDSRFFRLKFISGCLSITILFLFTAYMKATWKRIPYILDRPTTQEAQTKNKNPSPVIELSAGSRLVLLEWHTATSGSGNWSPGIPDTFIRWHSWHLNTLPYHTVLSHPAPLHTAPPCSANILKLQPNITRISGSTRCGLHKLLISYSTRSGLWRKHSTVTKSTLGNKQLLLNRHTLTITHHRWSLMTTVVF